MKNYLNKVLKACIGQARKGEINIDVFDLMYETSLPYPNLKDILDKLVSQNELAVIDIKTYKFIGDINRKFKENEVKEPDLRKSVNSSGNEDVLSARLAYLQKRRQEVIQRVRAAAEAKAKNENKDKDEDDELDRKFAEYERFLRSHEDDYSEEDENNDNNPFDCEGYAINPDETENGQTEEIIAILNILLQEVCAIRPQAEIPGHPSWDNESDFMRFSCECLTAIINFNKKMGRIGALKRAQFLLEDVQKIQNKKLIEVYEFLVFELQNMSTYHFVKIRNVLT